MPLQLLNASPTGSGSRRERRPLPHGYVFLEADIPGAATAASVLASFLPCPDGGGSASRQTFPDAEVSRGEARLPAMSEGTKIEVVDQGSIARACAQAYLYHYIPVL